MKTDLEDTYSVIAHKLGQMLGKHIVVTIESTKTGDISYDYKIYAGVLDEFKIERIEKKGQFEISLKVSNEWRNTIMVKDIPKLKWSVEMFEELSAQSHF